MTRQSAAIDRVFRALRDPTRRAILDQLSVAPASVTTLARPNRVTLTAVTQHLRVLEESDLVSTEKRGRTRICRVNPRGFDLVEQWVVEHRTLWERRLDRLGQVLADYSGEEQSRS